MVQRYNNYFTPPNEKVLKFNIHLLAYFDFVNNFDFPIHHQRD
jgi:hypothetical protein